MLKLQLARALHMPRHTRAEQGMALLRELDEAEPAETAADGPTPSAAAADRTCDQLIAMLRARLAAR